LLVQVLSHGRVGAISADEDVAVVGAVVGASDHNAAFILSERQNSLAKEDALSGNAAEQQIVKLWSRNDRVEATNSAERRVIQCQYDEKDRCMNVQAMRLSHTRLQARDLP